MEKSQSGEVVYLPHEDTPRMQQLRTMGYGILNDVISEYELKQREAVDKAREKEPAAVASGGR